MEENVEGVGREVGEIVFAEFFQGLGEIIRCAGDLGGVGIGLVFVVT